MQQLSALGRACTPEQVLITSGSQQGLDLVAKLFIDRNTCVALESPSYLAAIQAFRLFGARFVGHALFSDGIDLNALAITFKKHRPAFTYLIPTFQNPSGVCYSLPKRQELAQLFDTYHIPLVEDDPYRELMYEPVERQPICALVKEAPWIYLGSFSKTTCPGIRIGYLACSPTLFPLFVRLKQATDLHTNRLGQWWVARFLASHAYEPHIQRLRAYYKNQRDAMALALETHFSDIATWARPRGGLFFWIKLKQQQDTPLLLPKALAQNIAFMPGEPFFANDRDSNSSLRLNFSNARPVEIIQGIATLSDIIRTSE